MNLYCNVKRGRNIESRHEVYALAIDEDGKIIFSTGNPNYSTCIRSSRLIANSRKRKITKI